MPFNVKERWRARREEAVAFPLVKRLRRRLAVIFTALTSVILAGVLALGLWASLQRAEVSAYNDFLITVNSMATQLSYVSVESSVDFSALESIYGVKAGAAVNMEPVYETQGTVRTAVTGMLVEDYDVYDMSNDWANGKAYDLTTAIYIAASELQPLPVNTYVMVAQEAQTFEVSDGYIVEDMATASAEQTYYDVDMFTIGLESEAGSFGGVMLDYYVMGDADDTTFYRLIVLNDTAAKKRTELWLWAEYAAMLLGGVLLLAFVSWQLAYIVLRPTVDGLKRQAEFVAAASHELRSPLTVLRTSLAASRVAPDEAMSDRYQTAAETEAERMSRLVDDLLLLAGGDAGNWKLRTGPVEADTLLIEAVEQFRPVAKKQDVRLNLTLPDEALGSVMGDADRLHQILVVLLDNALQYAPENTAVEVRARRRKAKIEIEVADHGPGIPDEDKARVFQRFYRADKSRTDKKHFGLGLSVAQELAGLHGGALTVRDTEGGGATFRLVLPADG